MRKQMGVIVGLFTLALFVIVSGCETMPSDGNGNTNDNNNDNSMNDNTNDNSGDDNMNDNTGDDNMNDNTGDDNMNDNSGDDNSNDNAGNDNMNDNGDGGTGDSVAGSAFYVANGCVACHAADATGGIGPALAGVDATLMLENLDGTDGHPTTVEGVTAADAENLVAFVASLQ